MKKLVFVLLVCLLSGCAQQVPTPFETGEVVEPPPGCKMARKEGRNVDC